jgi:hypothetical protein
MTETEEPIAAPECAQNAAEHDDSIHYFEDMVEELPFVPAEVRNCHVRWRAFSST